MSILFATHNANKVEEVRQMLPDGLHIQSLSEIGWHEEIPETADTIRGNALLKAQQVYKKLQQPVLAEDTGLEVFALNKAPGVYTARYAGPQRDANDNMELLLRNLAPFEDRTAQFKTVIAFIDKGGRAHLFEGICSGHIAKGKSGEQGFGYDPVFVPAKHNTTFAEMTSGEKHKVSHRARALQQFLGFLQSTERSSI